MSQFRGARTDLTITLLIDFAIVIHYNIIRSMTNFKKYFVLRPLQYWPFRSNNVLAAKEDMLMSAKFPKNKKTKKQKAKRFFVYLVRAMAWPPSPPEK
jgi:hypothetical protein